MIYDKLPQDPAKCSLRNFSAAVNSSAISGGWYNFNAVTAFQAQGSALYLFDSYTFTGNISEQAFADSVATGAEQPPGTVDFKPVFTILWAAVPGGRADYFPALYPAAYGLFPIRAWAYNDTSDPVFITASLTFRLFGVASMGAPAKVRFSLGLNVFEIRDKEFIDNYQKKGIGWPS